MHALLVKPADVVGPLSEWLRRAHKDANGPGSRRPAPRSRPCRHAPGFPAAQLGCAAMRERFLDPDAVCGRHAKTTLPAKTGARGITVFLWDSAISSG
jgi:hypothetical protein